MTAVFEIYRDETFVNDKIDITNKQKIYLVFHSRFMVQL